MPGMRQDQPLTTERAKPKGAVLIISICTTAYFLDGLLHTVMGPLAPSVAKALSLSNSQLGPIFSANLIGQMFGLILFPLAAARKGHRAVIVVSLFGFGSFQLLSGFAESGTQLFALRLLTGVFLGGALPSCLAMVTAAAPIERRGFIITTLFTGYGAGCAIAGLVSLLFVLGGWRAAMILMGVVCLIVAVIAWRWLRDPPIVEADAVTETRAIRIAAQLISRPYALGTVMLWVLFISMLTISYCLNSWLPTLLVQVGRAPSLASMSVSIFGLGGILAALGIGALIDRFGPTRVLVSSLVLAALLILWIGQVLATASVPLLMLLLVLAGFFGLGAYAGVNVVLASFYPNHLRALGIGLTKSIGRVGTIIAPVLIGFGLDAGMRQTTVISLFAAPALLAAGAILMISAARRGKVDQA
ncbi:MFS transporter [soil metagenome]